MRLLLMLLPVLLSYAQENELDETTNWVNNVLKEKDKQVHTIESRFNLDQSKGTTDACTTSDGKEGKCVKPLYCEKEPEAKDPTTLFTYRETGCKNFYFQCCALEDVKQKPKKHRTIPDSCGWSNPGGYSLRAGGSKDGFSDFADFPWMIALLTQSNSENWSEQDYIGGGTLIHPSVVMTVAHKVDDKEAFQLKCRAGEWDTKTTDEILKHQDRNVKKIVIHEEFLKLRAHYDIALLFLEKPFVLKGSHHIGIACLGRNMPPSGTLCYSMGWGRSFNDPNNSSLLKKIKLPLVDPNTCQRQLRNTRLGSNFMLHHTLTCAGGLEKVDTCIGDGGSSLVCALQTKNSKTRFEVYGMVAFGVNCGVKDEPGVYANVPQMLDWVNRQMREAHLNSSYLIENNSF